MKALLSRYIVLILILFSALLFRVEVSHAQQTSTTTIQSVSKRIQLTLETPRDFGYSAGDIIAHKLYISIPSGTSLSTNHLPATGALLDWLDVIDVQVISQSANQYQITINYQVSKQVKETEWLEIPMFILGTTDQSEIDSLTVPAWRFSYYSLIPTRINDAEIILRSAQKPEVLAIQPVALQLITYLAAALLCMAYILWRRGSLQFWSRKTTAFQQALKDLKQLPDQSTDPNQIEQALRTVHSALNQTAGETVLESQLDCFYQNYPQLASLRSDTNQFFKQSRRIFYESSTSTHQQVDDNNLLKNLRDLCSRYDRLLRQR
jgi:hypothetical protein